MLLPVVNISAGGMLVRSEGMTVEPGDELAVFLDANDISFTMEASVMRCDAMYIALMWTSADDDATATLTKLLEYLAG